MKPLFSSEQIFHAFAQRCRWAAFGFLVFVLFPLVGFSQWRPSYCDSTFFTFVHENSRDTFDLIVRYRCPEQMDEEMANATSCGTNRYLPLGPDSTEIPVLAWFSFMLCRGELSWWVGIHHETLFRTEDPKMDTLFFQERAGLPTGEGHLMGHPAYPFWSFRLDLENRKAWPEVKYRRSRRFLFEFTFVKNIGFTEVTYFERTGDPISPRRPQHYRLIAINHRSLEEILREPVKDYFPRSQW